MILEPTPQSLSSSSKMTNESSLLSNASFLKFPPSSSRSPPTPLQSLSLGLLPLNPIQDQAETASIRRVKLSDIAPFEGSPNGNYMKAVEALAASLMRYNVALIEVGELFWVLGSEIFWACILYCLRKGMGLWERVGREEEEGYKYNDFKALGGAKKIFAGKDNAGEKLDPCANLN